jgi:tetratricopeptide (TPR) repeat protein
VAALEKALGLAAEELTRQLADYRDQTSHLSYTFKSPPAISIDQIPVRQLPPAEAALLFGTLLLQNGDLASAQRQLELAAQLDPALPEAHARLGELYRREKQHAASLQALDRALELAPNHAYARCERARLRLDAGNPQDYDAIQADLERAVQLRPDYATPYSALADLLEKSGGDFGTILALRTRSLQRFYRHDDNALKLAEGLLAAGQAERARTVASGVLWSSYREESRKRAGDLIEQARQLAASGDTVKPARPAAVPPHKGEALPVGQTEEPPRPRLQRRESPPAAPPWVTGVIRDVACQGFQLKLKLQSGTTTREFSSDNLLLLEFTDAVEPVPGNFEPCKKLAGRNARIAPAEADETQIESVSLLP